MVHGGAWTIPAAARKACLAGCRRALEAGWKVLDGGGSALDAVTAAIVVLEDDPVFDAGIGSHLNSEGCVELDAIVMDSSPGSRRAEASLASGAVASVGRIRNPIRAARAVMERSPHLLLVAGGAERFAEAHGLPLCDPRELVVERERKAWARCRAEGVHHPGYHRHAALGTVGAVALDASGRIVAGTSTGGTCMKLPGRVGDSPLIGCGCYADAGLGGASATGLGEAIMKVVLAKTAVDGLGPPAEREGPHPQRVAERAVRLLARRTGGAGGLILLDRRGRCGAAFNTPQMAWGWVSAGGSLRVLA
jgi:L-asparaginase / beta-aspartyl-peptidase